MPKVNFVKAARKDNPVAKKGESYYWWAFRYGGKHYSLTPPKASQLTQSEFLSRYYELSEIEFADNLEDLKSQRDEMVETLEELGDMAQESLDNMPDALQEGDTGQMLQERIDGCEEWKGELENLEFECEDDETEEEAVDRLTCEIEGSDPGLS
ncbi:hypothetical protein [Alteromonas phage JH01]|nr:hypothetical protein [Alteromonas phage JH01]